MKLFSFCASWLNAHMDKVYHFIICFISSIFLTIVLPHDTAPISFTFGLAIGKEYGDSRAINNKWDNYDLLADILGMFVGFALGLLLRSLIHV